MFSIECGAFGSRFDTNRMKNEEKRNRSYYLFYFYFYFYFICFICLSFISTFLGENSASLGKNEKLMNRAEIQIDKIFYNG